MKTTVKRKVIIKRILGWLLAIHVIPAMLVFSTIFDNTYNGSILIPILVGYAMDILLFLVVTIVSFVMWLLTSKD